MFYEERGGLFAQLRHLSCAPWQNSIGTHCHSKLPFKSILMMISVYIKSFSNLYMCIQIKKKEQECIPVGCVPPAH